jgi:copper(I)-binding protein
MLLDLKERLKEGETFADMLTFEKAGTVARRRIATTTIP